MVSEKKPSIYSDRGTIGSVDELDEYGVWVKSGPQDLSSAASGSQDFDDLSLPDFDSGPGEAAPDMSFLDSGGDEQPDFEAVDDPHIPLIDLSGGETGDGVQAEDADVSFDELAIPDGDFAPVDSVALEEEPYAVTEEPAALQTGAARDEPERGGQSDLSTQLLMKIAEELSSIRTELTSLKKEFAGVHVEAQAGDRTEAQHGGFFSEEDDEKIALTGDEMNNILNTAAFVEETGEAEEPDDGIVFTEEPDIALDFAPEEITVEDTGTAESSASGADEGTEEEEEEEIEIDFEDLGIDLNIDPSDFDKAREENGADQSLDETASETAAEETMADISLDDMAIDLGEPDFAADDFAPGELAAPVIEENLLVEESLLDENLFAEEPSAFSVDAESASAEESLFIEEAVAPDGGEMETGEIALAGEFGDSDELRQLRSDGVEPMTSAPDDSSYLEEDPLAGVIDESAISLGEEQDFDSVSIDLSEAVIDEPDLSGEIIENPVEEPSLSEISLDSLEDISIDLEDDQLAGSAGIAEEPELPVPEYMEEIAALELSPGIEDDSIAQVIPEGFEAEIAESPIPFDDDLDGAFDLTEDITGSVTIAEPALAAPAMEPSAGVPLETAPAESPAEETLDIPAGIKNELRTVLSYMDQLLESLPEEKIEEFAQSEYFDTYKKLFKELGLV
jgi:hypothetical protein